MVCERPFIQGAHAFSCGQCVPCRIRKRREWTHRIMLEAGLYSDNAFYTLTYDSENVPEDGSLVPSHTQDWLKRLRKAWEPHKVRYYLVGEYGDESFRPHYHVALFGYPHCARGRTLRFFNSTRPDWRRCCDWCRVIGDTWGFGDIDGGMLENDSAQYVAGYVVKKMTRTDDARLRGRWPEFARMSLRPGIGYHAMHEVASQLMRFNLDTTQGDVPVALRHGEKKQLPLGRYLRGNLRQMIGKPKNAPPEGMAKSVEELRLLRAEAFEAGKPLSKVFEEKSKGAIASAIARSKVRKKRGSL